MKIQVSKQTAKIYVNNGENKITVSLISSKINVTTGKGSVKSLWGEIYGDIEDQTDLIDYIDGITTPIDDKIDNHIDDTNNPHEVNPNQIGTYTGEKIDGLLDNKADKTNVLELDNTTPFTPNADYEPATKKYVDDEISGFTTDHNSLTGKQGGTTDEYYHLTQAEHTVVQNTSNTNTGDETTNTIKTKLGASNTSTDGYLSSTDWNNFNGKQNALGFTPENTANKNQNSGYAGLDSSGLINPNQLPALAISEYLGDFLDLTTALLDSGVLASQKGDWLTTQEGGGKTYFVITTSPTVVGDFKLAKTPTDVVTSVFGRTGPVTAQSGDYTTSQITESTNYRYLSDTQKTEATRNANTSQNGLLSSSDWNTFNNKQNTLGYTAEDVNNKKITMTGNESSNTFYLTAKTIYDWATGLFQTLSNKVISWQGTPDDTHYPSEKLVKDSLNEKVSYEDLPATIVLYPTTVASDIPGYYKMVSSITDTDYNTTAVDVTTGAITGSNQLLGQYIIYGAINGNPGVIDLVTVGNIKKISGSGDANFYYEIYKMVGGIETLLCTSNTTPIVTTTNYEQFSATALLNDGEFAIADGFVVKHYGNKIGGGSNPTYSFQIGGTSPVRTRLPVPISVIPTQASTWNSIYYNHNSYDETVTYDINGNTATKIWAGPTGNITATFTYTGGGDTDYITLSGALPSGLSITTRTNVYDINGNRTNYIYS